MITLNQLNKRQEDYIRNLDSAGLKTYIDNIAKTYYLNVINNDKLSANNSIEILNKIKMLHQDKNLDSYINHSLIMVFNEILISRSSGNINDFLMESPLDMNLNGLILKSELDKILDLKIHNQALKIEQEYQQQVQSEDDLKNLFNYSKYKI